LYRLLTGHHSLKWDTNIVKIYLECLHDVKSLMVFKRKLYPIASTHIHHSKCCGAGDVTLKQLSYCIQEDLTASEQGDGKKAPWSASQESKVWNPHLADYQILITYAYRFWSFLVLSGFLRQTKLWSAQLKPYCLDVSKKVVPWCWWHTLSAATFTGSSL